MFKYEHWETLLAPRIVLGIWHVSLDTTDDRLGRSSLDGKLTSQPKFIAPAKRHLPFLPLYAICMSVPTVREFFFQHCVGFSICFPALYSADGKRFRDEARAAGKKLTVWTVNDRSEMLECVRWGVRAVITDVPRDMVVLQEQVSGNATISRSASGRILTSRSGCTTDLARPDDPLDAVLPARVDAVDLAEVLCLQIRMSQSYLSERCPCLRR